MMNFRHITQWQTARVMTAADTDLSDDLRPAELTSAYRAKMTKVAPATKILIMPLALGDNNDSNRIRIYGFMDPTVKGGAGPGMVLADCTAVSGNKVWGSAGVPLSDGKWPSGAYRFIDTYTLTAGNMASALAILEVAATADVRSMFYLPTLGFSHLLFLWKTKAANTTQFGILWRPFGFEDPITKTHAHS